MCACVCVCQDEVTWLLSWAAREDPASCCQNSTNKKTPQETDHNAPRLAAPPLSESLCVFVRVPYLPPPPPTPSAMHTLALPLLTMPKQIWRWEMIHHWPCTAVSAPSYREVGHTKSCLKSLYPYCWKDSASYSWTSPLSPLLSWPEQVPASPGATFWSDSSNNFHVQCTLCERKPRDSLQLYVGVFYSARKGGWQSVKPAMKHVSLCLKELLTHLNQLKLFRFLWRVLPWHDGLNDLFEEALFHFSAEFGSFSALSIQIWDIDKQRKAGNIGSLRLKRYISGY